MNDDLEQRPNALKRFGRQPKRRYREFQIAYTILTLNFAIPAISYYADREGTVERARRLGERLGRPDLPKSEDSYLWWILGAGNVATLATMCALLQLDLRRNRPILEPLVALKAYSAIGYFFVWRRTRHPLFAAASLLDTVTCAAMAFFAVRAYRELVAAEEDDAEVEAVTMSQDLRPVAES